VALGRDNSTFEESFRLCIGSRNLKIGQGPTEGCRVVIITTIIVIIIYMILVLPPELQSHKISNPVIILGNL
jgi:hypothetical protein